MVAAERAEKANVQLSGGEGEEAAWNRQGGLGALFGIATGLGFGAASGLVRPVLGRVLPNTNAGVVLGLAAMAGSDVPSAALGVTNPAAYEAIRGG